MQWIRTTVYVFIRGPAVASASPSVWYSDHCSLGEEYPLVTLAYETRCGERGESIQRIIQELFQVYPMWSVVSPLQRVIMFQAVRNNIYVDVKINLFPGELKTESRSLQIKDLKNYYVRAPYLHFWPSIYVFF